MTWNRNQDRIRLQKFASLASHIRTVACRENQDPVLWMGYEYEVDFIKAWMNWC